jgi:hypothetical protein
MAKIFISYSRKDEAFARQLATRLSGADAQVWIDVEDIPVGQKWSQAIQVGLDDAEVMLVIISPDSMDSSNVADEWQYYLDHNKPVIPVLHKPAKIHFQLNRIQYIDFHQQDFESAYRKLHSELASKGVQLAPLPALPTQPHMSSLPKAGLELPTSRAGEFPWRAVGASILILLIALGLGIYLLTRGPSPSDQGEEFLKALRDENIGIARDLVCEDVRDQITVGQLWGLEMENIACQDGTRHNWINCTLDVSGQTVSTEFLVNDDNLICGGEY